MKTYEVEVVHRRHVRIRLDARDERAAVEGARQWAQGWRSVVIEQIDTLDEHVEAHPCRDPGTSQTPARPDPTHRCKVCGALWIKLPATPLGGWSLWSKRAGPCCDNVEMGEQIEPLTSFKRNCDPGPWGEPPPPRDPGPAQPAAELATLCAQYEAVRLERDGLLDDVDHPAEQVVAVRKRAEAAERWQMEVAEGLGFLNRPEGQGGHEVADPSVIVAAWKEMERDTTWQDHADEWQKRVLAAEREVSRLRSAVRRVADSLDDGGAPWNGKSVAAALRAALKETP
jgi:hypothetical protein